MSNRLENEIEHGKRLVAGGAESIWNWDSPSGRKRAERRSDYFINLSSAKSNDKVLEIGCGTGLFTRKFYNTTKANITAIDISEELLSEARQQLPKVDFKRADAMQMDFPDNTFDIVYGSSVLHHLEFNAALTEIYRVMKPNGKMIFAEPNMINPQILIQKNIPFIKKWLGDSPDETAIIRWSFARLMQVKGFKKISIVPYDFLHPAVPRLLINLVSGIGRVAEQIPLLKEIAGSVIIYGEK